MEKILQYIPRFINLAESGNMHITAKSLYITQPALSKSILTLEEELNTKLFERSSTGTVLTESGKIFLKHALMIKKNINASLIEIEQSSEINKKNIRIGAGPILGMGILPDIIKQVQKKFGDIKFELDIGTTSNFTQKLLEGKIDIFGGLVKDFNMFPEYFEKKILLDTHMCFVVSNNHKLAKRKNINIKDLYEFPFALIRNDIDIEQNLIALFEKNLHVSLNINVISNDYHALLKIVENGDYITCLSEPFAKNLQGYNCSILNVKEKFWNFTYGIIFNKSLKENKVFNIFLNLIEQNKNKI